MSRAAVVSSAWDSRIHWSMRSGKIESLFALNGKRLRPGDPVALVGTALLSGTVPPLISLTAPSTSIAGLTQEHGLDAFARNRDVHLRTTPIVEQHVMPLEADPANYDDHENIRLDVLRDTAGQGAGGRPVVAAGAEGLRRHGAADRRLRRRCTKANRSIFGRTGVHLPGADDGNMNLPALTGTKAQKDSWLKPIVDGAVRRRS